MTSGSGTMNRPSRSCTLTISMTTLGACALLSIATLMAETKIEKTSFAGWPNCYRISNGTIELIATSDIGPRIISLGFVGGKNLFRVFEETQGKTGGDKWNIYGGRKEKHFGHGSARMNTDGIRVNRCSSASYCF
jgi:hypothetical protein